VAKREAAFGARYGVLRGDVALLAATCRVKARSSGLRARAGERAGREDDGAIEILLGTGERLVVVPSASPELLLHFHNPLGQLRHWPPNPGQAPAQQQWPREARRSPTTATGRSERPLPGIHVSTGPPGIALWQAKDTSIVRADAVMARRPASRPDSGDTNTREENLLAVTL
jgi:hypothetical protein